MTRDARQSIERLLKQIRSAQVTYFPIRHHSPACAAHVQRWIRQHKPSSILIEGPSSFTSLIDLLLDSECVCPVAIYTSFARKTESEHTARFAAYYPFCDYSPELVAMREGHAIGSALRFIDLEYAEMVLTSMEEKPTTVRIDSLVDDPHLRHSEYVAELSRRLGCRDFNELWDHLFEQSWDGLETDELMDRIATWCALVRMDYSEAHLHSDGTQAREACMASAIVEEIEKNEGPVLVVTGGFHTVALPDLVAKGATRPETPSFSKDEIGTWLIRYSFDHLDALAGYASGMPGPAFYDRLWDATQAAPEDHDQARADVAADLIVEIGRLTRELDFPNVISTPDAIAAVQMTKDLANLRGHPWPMREDVLDGMRSCYIKGEVDVEGRMLLQLVRKVLSGDRIGRVPSRAGSPPIVVDFQREAKRLKLKLDATTNRELSLDLYRKALHREISRFFHRLDLLQIPFASFVGGPDFVNGTGLDLMIEHWRIHWSPATESSLIEASIFGPTIENAAGVVLQRKILELEDEGRGRSTDHAVTLLVRACRMGLHSLTPMLLPLIDQHIAEDSSLPSVVNGLSQLELLLHSLEPLEATNLTTVPELMNAAYQRACRLLAEVVHCPDDQVEESLKAIQSLREIVASSELDAELFSLTLTRMIAHPPEEAQATIVGAALGILYGERRITEEDLIRMTAGFVGGTSSDPRKTCGVLRGLLATAREIAWQVSALIEAVDSAV